MELEIHTHNKDILFDLLGKSPISRDDSIITPGNAKLTYKGTTIRLAEGLPKIINLVVTFGSGVAAGVVSNWIYDKLKHKTEKIVINRKEIHLDEGELKRVLEETIRIER